VRIERSHRVSRYVGRPTEYNTLTRRRVAPGAGEYVGRVSLCARCEPPGASWVGIGALV